jgi:hypothetical protein
MANQAFENAILIDTEVDVHNLENRTALAKMVIRLFDHWALPTADQAALLGFATGSRSTLARYRKGSPLDDNVDLLGRVGHLLGIHKALRIIFPHNRDLVYRWVITPNRRFGGKCPVEIMRNGYEGLLAVRRYLDFERGR